MNDVVTVACRLPNGLTLQLSQVGRRYGPRYKVLGTRDEPSPGGFALTRGVPRAFWEAWVEQNRGRDYVVHRHVFAYP
jgi:hypothetical protein